MALIQEPWYREDCIRGWNIPGYTLYSAAGTDTPRAPILARNTNIWVLPGFSCKDLVAVLVKYVEDGAERQLLVCFAYLPYDAKDPPPSRELEELVQYSENENLYLIVGCDSNGHGVAPTAMIEGKPWWNFSILRIWRFLIRAMSPPFALVIGKR
jgi:hypothetical protein